MTGRLVTFGEGLGVLRARESGSLAHSSDLLVGTGGAEGNVAIGVARLGGHAVWLGRVGDDGLGARVARELRAEGVTVIAPVEPAVPTGLLIKESPAPGRTRISYYRAGSAGSRITPEDLDALLLAPDDIVHVTGITPALSATAAATVLRALDLTEEAGATVSFDVNHRSRLWAVEDASEVYRRIAARADILFAGDDEARILAPGVGDDPADLAAALAELGPTEVLVKLGARGAVALVDGAIHEVAPVPVEVVDTVGAGDAFVAGYLADRLAGEPLAVRLATAARAGAFACTHAGDWEGLPRRADLLAHGHAADGDPVSR